MQLLSNVYVFSLILFYVLAENANPIHDQEKFGNRKEFHISSHPRNIVTSSTSLQSRWCSSGRIFPGHTTLLLQEHQTMMENEIKVHPRDSKGRIIFMVEVQRH